MSTAIRLKSAWWLAVFGAATFGSPASAQGLLNAPCAVSNSSTLLIKDYKTYPATTIGRGHDMAAFVRGKNDLGVDKDYMMLVWSMDSGKGDGGISFWSWDRPSTWSLPTLKRHYPAPKLREAHSTPVTNMVGADWRTWTLQTTTGVAIYNLDSVASPALSVDYTILGNKKGGAGSPATCGLSCAGSFDAVPRDYDEGAVWFIALAAPYLYVAQAANGLNIYKFTNPANAASLTWVKRYDMSWFGHRVNQFWVRGNLGIAAAVEANYGVTIVDMSDPQTLVKLKSYGLTTTPPIRNAYAWTLNGSALYAATKAQTGGLVAGLAVYDIDPVSSALTKLTTLAGGCSSGGYVAVQDEFAHIGLSTCYHKIKRDPGTGALSMVALPSPPYSIPVLSADDDFTTPFGNAIFLGNDHHTTPGSIVLCHDPAKDIKPPAVNGRNPRNGATLVNVSTGVGLSFTDNLKPWTLGKDTLPIRLKGTSTAIPGYYSYQLNTVNFRPAVPFAKGATYEVVVTSGVKDLAGNGATFSVGSFKTAN